VHVISETPDELVVDLVGIDAPIANALRRIMLSEVSSVAIEDVYIATNTSIIQDEVGGAGASLAIMPPCPLHPATSAGPLASTGLATHPRGPCAPVATR